MYAGVPIICMPNSGDQFLNSSLVEHLGIGIFYIEKKETLFEKFKKMLTRNKRDEENSVFKEALDAILGNIHSNNYQIAASNLRNKILTDFDDGNTAERKFIDKIVELVGN
uniref:Glucuronosyltransferase n=1 Tax=Meloidogyne javanica TaxID=6303 RepID=A0A915MKB3_MELJA